MTRDVVKVNGIQIPIICGAFNDYKEVVEDLMVVFLGSEYAVFSLKCNMLTSIRDGAMAH